MAYSRAVSRICTRLQSVSPKFNPKSSGSLSPDSSPFLKSACKPQVSPSSHRRTSRLPLELSALITMMPLHSAIASACLKSGLLIESQSWGLVPQVKSIDRFEVRCEITLANLIVSNGLSYLNVVSGAKIATFCPIQKKWKKAFQCLYDTSFKQVPSFDM